MFKVSVKNGKYCLETDRDVTTLSDCYGNNQKSFIDRLSYSDIFDLYVEAKSVMNQSPARVVA